MSNIVYLKNHEEDFYDAFICFNKNNLMSCYICGHDLCVRHYDSESDFNSMLDIYKADWNFTDEKEYKRLFSSYCSELSYFVKSIT